MSQFTLGHRTNLVGNGGERWGFDRSPCCDGHGAGPRARCSINRRRAAIVDIDGRRWFQPPIWLIDFDGRMKWTCPMA